MAIDIDNLTEDDAQTLEHDFFMGSMEKDTSTQTTQILSENRCSLNFAINVHNQYTVFPIAMKKNIHKIT